MTVRRTGSRRAQTSLVPPDRPVYARVLQLRHLHPSGLVCFVLFEGMAALGALLALAELTNWWAVLVLPGAVAATVKFNDVLAGLLAGRPPSPVRPGPVFAAAAAAAPASTVRAVAEVPAEAGAVTRPRPRPGPGPVGATALPPVLPKPRGSAAVPAHSRMDPDAPPPRVERQVSRDPKGVREEVRSRRQQSRQSAARRYG